MKPFPSNRDIDASSILALCKNAVPVNCKLNAAIEAHQRAAAVGEPLSGHALRAVILSRTPTIDDARAQLDYVTALPSTAWEVFDHRDETLQAMARSIAWRSEH